MCTVCGCGSSGTGPAGGDHGHTHPHAPGRGHSTQDHHHHAQASADPARSGIRVLGGVHAPGMNEARVIRIEADILGENQHYAETNRAALAATGTIAINLLSGPGAGKTSLLVRTVEALAGRLPVAVIEGDQQTTFDAERIQSAGAPSIQINTGKGCHLDAHMVGHALADLERPAGGVVFIENVGNLVCPAAFDLGETARVVLLSVTEGDDKPLKYPDMFATADLLLITKTDLKPYVPFSVDRAIDFARRIRPDLEVLEVSALRGAGLDDWLHWIGARCTAGSPARAGAPA